MHFVAWNGERWSMPFQPNELIADCSGGLMDREGCSVAWDADGYRGENWIALKHWTEERAKAITSNAEHQRRAVARPSVCSCSPGGQDAG